MPSRTSSLLVLAVAVLGISLAGPLVRLSDSHPLAIALWRLGFSMVLIAIPLLATGGWRQWRRMDRRGVVIALAAGAMLAVHFWSWNASIGLTTIAASVVLVNLQPAIVAALSVVWLRESPDRRQWSGIAVAMLGALVVAVGDFGVELWRGVAGGAGGRALVGNLLALVGAVTAALYYLAGRRLRQALDLWPYVALVYGACFVTLLALVLALRVPAFAPPPRELAIFAGLALGPMMLGHTGMNWALRYLPAYVVNLTVLGEPVGATLLAALLPAIGERPSAATLLGGALILAGILLAARKP